MDLFEKIKLIIETQGYIPFDIGNVKKLFTGPFLTPNNAFILHLTSLENPNDHSPILPENAYTIDAEFSPDDSWIAIPLITLEKKKVHYIGYLRQILNAQYL